MGFGRMDDRMIWFFKCIRERKKENERERDILYSNMCKHKYDRHGMSFSLKTCTDKADNRTQV